MTKRKKKSKYQFSVKYVEVNSYTSDCPLIVTKIDFSKELFEVSLDWDIVDTQFILLINSLEDADFDFELKWKDYLEGELVAHSVDNIDLVKMVQRCYGI